MRNEVVFDPWEGHLPNSRIIQRLADLANFIEDLRATAVALQKKRGVTNVNPELITADINYAAGKIAFAICDHVNDEALIVGRWGNGVLRYSKFKTEYLVKASSIWACLYDKEPGVPARYYPS